ncbi:hypothetical protein [Mesorhizobium sp.]|uniref:hypothetical protein n=1 Tax=Mesorhizobium sp. TaxID=1871066 RepID=UPI00257E8AE6|nr:hypothetical protein [Mesorhizobium sp.]
MKILEIRPTAGSKTLAYFDIELGEHLRIYNLMLRRGLDGKLRTLAPNACGKHSATFHPILAEQISQAAAAAFNGGRAANVPS